jgi:hypothetical protein
MAAMSSAEFEQFKNQIKVATTASELNQISSTIKKFRADMNMLSLGSYFNKYIQVKGLDAAVERFDLEHIQMLMKLFAAAYALRLHIERARNQFFGEDLFSIPLHVRTLNDEIEARKETTHYSQYCDYFYKKIYQPLIHHHPKIQRKKPTCIALCEEQEKMTAAAMEM